MHSWKEFLCYFTIFLMCGIQQCDARYMPFDSDEYIPMEISSENRLLGGSRSGQLIQGSLTLSPGIHGNALDLDGSSIIDLGDARLECFLTPDECPNGFTLSFWLYDDGEISNKNVYYISSGGQTSRSYGVAVLRNCSNGRFFVKTRTESYGVDFDIPLGEWVHIVVSWYPDSESYNFIKVYINGVSVAINIQVVQVPFLGLSDFNNIHLGAPNNVNNYISKAKLDELLFWHDVKDEEFVKHLYDAFTDSPSCSHCIAAHYFETKAEQTVTAGVFITITTIHNEVSCAMECLKYHLCLGVNWINATRHCELFSVVYGSGVYVSNTNSTVFVKL